MSSTRSDKAIFSTTRLAAMIKENGLRTVGWIAWIIVLIWSLGTTAIGMNVLLGSSALARALTLSGVIQTIQATSVLSLLRRGGRKRWRWMVPIAFTAYILCLSISVGFSVGFWFEKIGIRGRAKSLAEMQRSKVEATAMTIEAQLAGIAAHLANLQQTSQDKAQAEIETGGTCDATSFKSRGSRAKLRERDSREFHRLREAVGEPRNKLKTVIEKLHRTQYRVDRHQQVWREIVGSEREIKALAHSINHDNVIHQLKKRIQMGRDGQFFDEQNKIHFRCSDSELEDLMVLGVSALKEHKKFVDNLSESTDDIPPAPDYHSALLTGYRQLADRFGLVADVADNANESDFRTDHSLTVSFVIVIVIEGLTGLIPILLMGLQAGDPLAPPSPTRHHPLVPGLDRIRTRFPNWVGEVEIGRLYVQFINGQSHQVLSDQPDCISSIFRPYIDLSNRYLLLPKVRRDPRIELIRVYVQAAPPGTFQLVAGEMQAKVWRWRMADRTFNEDKGEVVVVYKISKGLINEIFIWDFMCWLEPEHKQHESTRPVEVGFDAPHRPTGGNGKPAGGDRVSD